MQIQLLYPSPARRSAMVDTPCTTDEAARQPSRQATSVRFAPWAVLLALVTGVGQAETLAGDDGRWQFKLVPYLWLPSVSASINTIVPAIAGPGNNDPRSININAQVNPDSYLRNLQAAFMMIGEARKGPWLIYTDLVYTSVSGQDARVRTVSGPFGRLSTDIGYKAQLEMGATVWTLGAGYAIVQQPTWGLDLVAGFRFLDLSNHLNLSLRDMDGRYYYRALGVSRGQQNWDGVVGTRGTFNLSDRWYVPFYADIGAGSSQLTWQAILGLGYRFDWGDISLAWKALHYTFDNNADLTLAGPGLGVGFRW